MPACDTVATEDKAVDWAELRALHVKGVSLADLSKRFNVSYSAIRNKSSRERWRDTVAKANEHVMQGATDALQASANSWIGKIDQFGHRIIDHYLDIDPKTAKPKDIELAVNTVATLAQHIVRPNYGLDKPEANNKPASLTVNVAISNPTANQARYTGQVIDIEQVSSATASADTTPAMLTDADTPADAPATQPAKRKRVR